MDTLPTSDTVALLDAASRLSVIAFFIVLSALALKRKIITMGEKRDSDAEKDARLAEMRQSLVDEKQLTKALVRRLDRFQIVLERLTGVKVPPDPDASEGDA